MALLDTITDDFEDGVLAAVWSGSHGGTDEAAGRARVPSGTGFPALATAAAHTLAGSSVFARMYPAGVGTSTTATSEMLIDSATAGTRIIIVANTVAGNIQFRSDVDYGDASGVTLTYDATAHAWWRIREAAGTVYMETSPDAATWTIRRQFATPAWATGTTLPLIFSTHRDVADAGLYLEVDNVNLAPPATPPATPTGLTVSASDTTAVVSWNPTDTATGYEVEYQQVADAGVAVKHPVRPWLEVELAGSGTDTWTQVSGPPVTIVGTGATVTFVVPPSLVAQEFKFAFGASTVTVTASRAKAGIVMSDGTVKAVRMRALDPNATAPAPTRITV